MVEKIEKIKKQCQEKCDNECSAGGEKCLQNCKEKCYNSKEYKRNFDQLKKKKNGKKKIRICSSKCILHHGK